jgi:hypothetical protein
MIGTILGLLVALAIVSFILWLILSALYRFARRQAIAARDQVREVARQVTTQPEPPAGPESLGDAAANATPFNPAVWLPVPPGATLLRVDNVPIAQAGDPAPMLRTRGVTGTALWYRARGSYSEVANWYATHLPDDGWQEEEGHGAMRVFQRASTLLWVSDATNPDVWRRLTQPNADPPRRAAARETAQDATFTVLTYRTDGSAPPSFGRWPFGGMGRFGGGPGPRL